MKQIIAIACVSIALITSAEARTRHHHKNPIVVGLGAGLIHMLKSMDAHQKDKSQ